MPRSFVKFTSLFKLFNSLNIALRLLLHGSCDFLLFWNALQSQYILKIIVQMVQVHTYVVGHFHWTF